MGEGMVSMIKQVGVFIICSQMLLHFKPSESYGKYLRLLVSMMILIQLLLPCIKLFTGEGEGNLLNRILYYEQVLQSDMESIQFTCEEAEELRTSLTEREINSRLNNDESEGIEKIEKVGVEVIN